MTVEFGFGYEGFVKFVGFITVFFRDKKQSILLKCHIKCAIIEIQQSQSYYKWLESRLHLLVKVEKRYCGIKRV